MNKLKYLLPALAILMLTGAIWFKEHDSKIRWRAVAEYRAVQLVKKDSITQTMWRAIKAMDSAYAGALSVHTTKIATMRETLVRQDKQIDRLAVEIEELLPDSVKGKVDSLVFACRAQIAVVMGGLGSCENLRHKAELSSSRKDTVIKGLADSRDAFRKLWEESGQPKANAWSTVGKVSTLGALLATVTKLFGLW